MGIFGVFLDFYDFLLNLAKNTKNSLMPVWITQIFFLSLWKFCENGYSYECKKCFEAYECRIYIYKFIYNEFDCKKS